MSISGIIGTTVRSFDAMLVQRAVIPITVDGHNLYDGSRRNADRYRPPIGPQPKMPVQLIRPTLSEVDNWFDSQILPNRTTWAGLSYNRLWITPRALLVSKPPIDPNGICGETTDYVMKAYRERFQEDTSDGYHIGVILWEDLLANHIAVVMQADRHQKQSYTMLGDHLRRIPVEGIGSTEANAMPGYRKDELFDLHVYDLYYKKRVTVGVWWKDVLRVQDNVKTMLSLGPYHAFD
jgi:hypothetical protein